MYILEKVDHVNITSQSNISYTNVVCLLRTKSWNCEIIMTLYSNLYIMSCKSRVGYYMFGVEWNEVDLFNRLRPRQNHHQFIDDILKNIFLNENVWISIKISLKFVPRGSINNIPALVQIMAWRQPGGKPIFEPMMVRLLMHICVTRPQWVKSNTWHHVWTQYEPYYSDF